MSYIFSVTLREILLYRNWVKDILAYSKENQFKACTEASFSPIPTEYNQWKEEYESW